MLLLTAWVFFLKVCFSLLSFSPASTSLFSHAPASYCLLSMLACCCLWRGLGWALLSARAGRAPVPQASWGGSQDKADFDTTRFICPNTVIYICPPAWPGPGQPPRIWLCCTDGCDSVGWFPVASLTWKLSLSQLWASLHPPALAGTPFPGVPSRPSLPASWLPSFPSCVPSQVSTLALESCLLDFPGGPMVRTPRCHCRGLGFDPWWGKIPHAARHGQKNK